jgi:hypothetical protein
MDPAELADVALLLALVAAAILAGMLIDELLQPPRLKLIVVAPAPEPEPAP